MLQKTENGMDLFAKATNEWLAFVQLDTIQILVGLAVVLVAIGSAWGSLRSSVRQLGRSLDKMDKNIDDMRSSLTTHTADTSGLKAHTKYGVSNSPTIPSEVGHKVLEASGFNAQYPALKEKIFKLMDQKSPRTLYDYEVQAFEALQELRDDPLIDPLKDYAVNNPDKTLELIFKIASWIIRDDYVIYKSRSILL
jgi:hypothetical protein